MPKDDNCVHKDHRKRMKTKFVHSGADAFETHQLLEMLLFYAIPQKDTNPLAHDLLQNFGSLNSVLNADYESLTQLCGVKENTAVLLKLIFALARRSEQEKLSHCDIHSDFDSVGEFLVRQYRLLDKELVYLLLFDNSRRMFGVHQIHEGSVNSAMVVHQKIAKLALMRNAAGIVLAHNHPGGVPIPSGDDTRTTRALGALFSALGIPLLDHYVVAGNRYYGIVSGKSGDLGRDDLL